MRKHIHFLIWTVFFLPFTTLDAQSFQWAAQYGDTSGESLKGLTSDASGNLYLCGNFSENIQIGTNQLTADYEEDMYLISTDNQGQSLWGESVSSPENIDIGGLAIHDDALYVTAQYWGTAIFEDSISLSPTQGSGSAFFLLKYSTAGQFIWTKSIDGNGLKKVEDIHTDHEGNVYLTGYFGKQLFTEMNDLIAEGNTNFFILKYTPDGELLWAKSAGDAGDIRARSVATDEQGGVYVSGNFEGDMTFAGELIEGNGLDNDIFLLKYDEAGNEIWLREIRGVFEDAANDMAVDENGNIYLTGAFSGVLRLGDVEFNTIGFNDDVFIAKYNFNGDFFWAKTFAGSGFGSGESLILDGEKIYLGGEFRGESIFGSTSLTSDEIRPDIFIMAMDTSGTFEWVKQGGSMEVDLLEQLTLLPDGRLVAGGSFNQYTHFNHIQLTAKGGYDAYLFALHPLLIHTTNTFTETDVNVFPVPARDMFFVKINNHFRGNCRGNILDNTGKIIQTFSWYKSQLEQTFFVPMKDLPIGVYIFTLECKGNFWYEKITITN